MYKHAATAATQVVVRGEAAPVAAPQPGGVAESAVGELAVCKHAL